MRLRFLALTVSVAQLASASKCKHDSGSHESNNTISHSFTASHYQTGEGPQTSLSTGSYISSIPPSYTSSSSISASSTSSVDSSSSSTASSVDVSSSSFSSSASSSTSSFASSASDITSSAATASISSTSSDSSSISVSSTSNESSSISVSTTSSDSSSTSVPSTSSDSSSTSSSSTSSSTSSSVPEPTQICQAYGSRIGTVAIATYTTVSDNTFLGCSAQCSATDGCASFSIQIETGGSCSLYVTQLYLDFVTGTSGPTVYFDADCPAPVVEGPSMTYVEATVTVPTFEATPTSVVTFSEFTTPTIESSDSPPYTPTGAQETPTDDAEFMATYTWTEFELTMAATGSPPITTGVPHPTGTDLEEIPCMIMPSPQSAFTVLNQQFIPMVSTTGSIGPLAQPTEAPAAGDPLLDPASLQLPVFYLQVVDGVDAYDLVYADSKKFVAMGLAGDVILVDASTGTSYSDGYVTTIFNIDCLGRMTITLNGVEYNWTTNKGSCSILPGSADGNQMKALPETLPSDNAQKRKRTSELYDELTKFKKRLATPTNGGFSAPQCPATPAGLVSGTKPGYESDKGNLCDAMSDNWQYSPYDFGDACDVQSACYDQCTDYSYQGCNLIFYASMLLTCSEEIGDEWWDVVSLIACGVQAVYYLGVAETSTGRDAYYHAMESMCACFCDDPQSTCVYTGSDKYYCANLHSNDLDNCGACGAQCGANAACKSGKCGCPANQCGTTCLDFRSNPNNCGSCGHVCDPHYCIGGECYTPNPEECNPEQSVTNYMFDTYSPTWTNWTVGAFDGTTLGTNLTYTPSLYTPASGQAPVYGMGVTMTNIPNGGFHGYIQQKNVKMCPGFNYELTFAMGYVNQVDSSAVTSNADCYVRWVTGKPGVWSNNDGFQYSPNYGIGASNPTYATFGPWTLNVVAGQTGVNYVKPNYYVDLTAIVSCDTPVGGTGHFVLTDVQMTPVSQIPKTTKRSSLLENTRSPPSTFKQRATTGDDSEAYDAGELVAVSYVKTPSIKGRNPLTGSI